LEGRKEEKARIEKDKEEEIRQLQDHLREL
jgi:hypothetical protein